MNTDPVFLLGLSLMLLHELDAVRCHEWRNFPGLSALPERMAKTLFLVLHVPLFYWILHALAGPVSERFIVGFNIFFVVHLGLHLVFLLHPKNEFKDALSWAVIGGAALCGAWNLFLV